MTRRSKTARRVAALLALAAGAAAVVALAVAAVVTFPAGLLAIAAALVAVAAAWLAATRRGTVRALAGAGALLALAGIVAVLVWRDAIAELAIVAALAALAAACAGFARNDARSRPPPGAHAGRAQRGVLLMNPKSGGGKVERFGLVAEARRRGVEPILLEPGDDLRRLALEAVGRGAQMLGMAGGDGSQAVVAAVAMEHDLPYACIPAGTRNHLALDLGVDREDVAGALDAYVDGVERRIDLATVGGRVFVNNVSLGLYAQVVQSGSYRDAKLRTAAELLPDLAGPEASGFDLRFGGPGDTPQPPAQLLLVSNNPYRLDHLFGLGSRPRIDGGRLGIVALSIDGAAEAAAFVALEAAGRVRRFGGWREWTAETFEVRSARDVPAGVDGEALTLTTPLSFALLPGALRVRVAPHHPGRSPAALHEGGGRGEIAALTRLALHGPRAA